MLEFFKMAPGKTNKQTNDFQVRSRYLKKPKKPNKQVQQNKAEESLSSL